MIVGRIAVLQNVFWTSRLPVSQSLKVIIPSFGRAAVSSPPIAAALVVRAHNNFADRVTDRVCTCGHVNEHYSGYPSACGFA